MRIAVAAMLITSCARFSLWDDPAPEPYLHAVLAEQQPESRDLGVIVLVQGRGGNFLSLSVQEGSLRFLANDAATPSRGACVPFTTTGIIPIVVKPDQAEANLYANLYNLDVAPNADGGSQVACVTGAMPVAAVIVPIAPGAMNTPTIGDAAIDVVGDVGNDAPVADAGDEQ